MDQALSDASQKIEGALNHLQTELTGIRAGRANPSLVENIPVDAYGGKMKLVELGTISAPQSSLLTIQVWDSAIVNDVIKAIQTSGLGLNPSNEGNVVRLPIPPLTEERRQEFIKLLHQKLEQTRVSIRQVRQEERELWELQKNSGEFGEDELFRREKILQELIDKKMQELEELSQKKEEELTQL